MLDKVFDVPSHEDLPAGYKRIRNAMLLIAINNREHRYVLSQKLLLYSGIQNISVENVNKSNEKRVEIFNDLLPVVFPYMPKDSSGQRSSMSSSTEDMIEEYKRLFGDKNSIPKEQKEDGSAKGPPVLE